MKILIFSDTHLRQKFDPFRFQFLEKIISQADRVIINGDFWDGLFISFDDFINSPWRKLFPLLKKKKTVYVFGNHDGPKKNDKRTNLFSDVQTKKFRLPLGDKTLIITHGHHFSISIFEWMKKCCLPRSFFRFVSCAKNFVFKIAPRLVLSFFRRFNQEIKGEIAGKMRKNEILVCGHTHAAEIDLKNHFIDTGCIEKRYASYLLIDTDSGKLILKEEVFPWIRKD